VKVTKSQKRPKNEAYISRKYLHLVACTLAALLTAH